MFYRDKETGDCWTVIAITSVPIRQGYRGTIVGYRQHAHWMYLGKIDG